MAISYEINQLFLKETGPNNTPDYFPVDWKDLLKIDDGNAHNSIKIYLDKINMLLDTYAPLKKINKYKLKFKSKPWITLGL